MWFGISKRALINNLIEEPVPASSDLEYALIKTDLCVESPATRSPQAKFYQTSSSSLSLLSSFQRQVSFWCRGK